MRYFLYFAYNGTNFHGWQRQPNAITVQWVMEDALTTVMRHPTSLTGAGRTDTGVHAEAMVAHFDTIAPIESKQQFCTHLNSLLPPLSQSVNFARSNLVHTHDSMHYPESTSIEQPQRKTPSSRN